MKHLLIVVNYNQENEIESFLRRLSAYHPISETLVVDDGSTDRSPAIARSLGYRLICHVRNQGVGAAIRTGILEARKLAYDYVIINSSNGKMQPEDLHAIRAPIERDKADFTTGSRFLPGGASPALPWFRRLAIPAFSCFLGLFLRRRFSDITCGYRAFRIDWIFESGINIQQRWLNRYELEFYILYWACRTGRRITEVPISIRYDHLGPGRETKIIPILDWLRMISPVLLLHLGLRR